MNTNPTTTEEEDAAKDLVRDLESLATELNQQKELYLRLAADFDNFRKRTAQESNRRAAAQKEDFIRDLLSIIDNLERAVASDQSTSPEQLREGVKMTLQQLHQLLRRHGIEPQKTDGQPFDPHQHEAIGMREDPFQPEGMILETMQRGYQRGEEPFRPAKVIVNKLKEPPAAKADADTQQGEKKSRHQQRR